MTPVSSASFFAAQCRVATLLVDAPVLLAAMRVPLLGSRLDPSFGMVPP
jgi:hypothetical protein